MKACQDNGLYVCRQYYYYCIDALLLVLLWLLCWTRLDTGTHRQDTAQFQPDGRVVFAYGLHQNLCVDIVGFKLLGSQRDKERKDFLTKNLWCFSHRFYTIFPQHTISEFINGNGFKYCRSTVWKSSLLLILSFE